VNLLFIDELVDNGMDAVGLDNALGILKDFVRKRNKSVWMVSHKDELLSRVDSVLHVVKQNGYTSFRMGDEE
jgi:DNA repair exonuclease SbcCD ATPase subunit